MSRVVLTSLLLQPAHRTVELVSFIVLGLCDVQWMTEPEVGDRLSGWDCVRSFGFLLAYCVAVTQTFCPDVQFWSQARDPLNQH